MATLEAGLTRDEAFALLQEHNKDPFHIEHGETVEQTMRYFAREFDPENEEFWGIVGLLHDLDWEEHDDEPELHTIYDTASWWILSRSTRWRRSCSPPKN